MKIRFKPNSRLWEESITAPIPAKSQIPEWYKSQSLYMGGEKKYALHDRTPNTTVKACSPFSDALSMGYVWTAPLDIQIQKIPNGNFNDYRFDWRIDEDFVTFHSLQQIGEMPPAYNGERGVCKWTFDYRVETPKGYSTLFTHPLNRHELPFRTFTGVIDTDFYNQPIQFPFQLLDLKDEYTIIEKGTPLVQIIPIKRETWDSETTKYDELESRKASFEYFSKIYRAYKTRYWHRKEYR